MEMDVSVEELKIINGGHDWPSPLNSWETKTLMLMLRCGTSCLNTI